MSYPQYRGQMYSNSQQPIMGSENQIMMRSNPYKVAMDRNADSYRIHPSARSRLQLTPDTNPNPDTYQLKPKKLKKVKKLIRYEEPLIYDADPALPKLRSRIQTPVRPRYIPPEDHDDYDSHPMYYSKQQQQQQQQREQEHQQQDPSIRFPTDYLINNNNNNHFQTSDRVLLPRRQKELKKLRQQQQQQQQYYQQQQHQPYHNQQQQQQQQGHKTPNSLSYRKPSGTKHTLRQPLLNLLCRPFFFLFVNFALR